MSKLPVRLFLVSATWLAMAGCGGAEVTIRHVLPPDLSELRGADALIVGDFQPRRGADARTAAWFAEQMRRLLDERAPLLAPEVAGRGGHGQVRVGGSIFVRAEDVNANRFVRALDPDSGRMGPRKVATLVRTVGVRVDFVLTDLDDGEALGAVEARAGYSSLSDPRVRGELGLGRPDDPRGVPDKAVIVRELLVRCADTFGRMITPPVVEAKVLLRGTLNKDGQEALSAAARGDYEAAERHAGDAVKSDPRSDDLLFNLAVIQELAGNLEAAMGHYLQVAKRSPALSGQARTAIDRIRRVQGRLARYETAKGEPR